jgi:hypothetical protein
MYRRRHLGVKEGNAIEDIVAFEMRQKRGVATSADKLAHDRACQLLGIRRTASNIVHPAFQGSVPHIYPPVSNIINPIDFREWGQAFKLVGAVFLLWALGCILLYMVVAAANGLASFAYP